MWHVKHLRCFCHVSAAESRKRTAVCSENSSAARQFRSAASYFGKATKAVKRNKRVYDQAQDQKKKYEALREKAKAAKVPTDYGEAWKRALYDALPTIMSHPAFPRKTLNSAAMVPSLFHFPQERDVGAERGGGRA